MIALEPVGRDQRARVDHVAVAPEQTPFCGTIAAHFAADERSCDFHAVTRDGRAVGFFKIDRDYAALMEFAAPGQLGLRGMMIDRAEQGRGTGKAAMHRMRAYLVGHYPWAHDCLLTVNISNPAARAIYLTGGFVDEGGLYLGGNLGPQHILRLDLTAGA
ncbi:GNAT family N-acetyltransferase [Paracoccus sp. (in: a-proteobacteria)]|uniref:GNAT family N-acetyltransferase n=1 Tax=Paracoccus sp. TaxID=267 RepID=UPI00396CA750